MIKENKADIMQNHNDKKNLYLITDGFPFGKGEKPFILPELPYLIEEYNITVISPAPTEIASVKEEITPLDKRIRLVHLPMDTAYVSEELAKQMIASSVMQDEYKRICQKGELIQERANFALNYLIGAELFYTQLKDSNAIDFESPSVIYTYWCTHRTLAIALHIDEFADAKLVTRFHGYDLYEYRAPYGYQPFRYVINEKCAALFFVSQKGLEYYAKTFANENILRKMYLASLGVVSAQNYRKNSFKLVSCANLIPLKRVDMIIRALSLIDDIKIHWTHFGDGAEMENLLQLAENLLKPKTNIFYEFAGHLANEQIMNIYANYNISCFITLSSTEGGSPVSIQEALSFGIPIIGTDVGGISATIDGNGVLLGENPTPKEAAEAIKSIYNLTEDEARTMSNRSYEIWKEKFDAGKNALRFLKYLQE